MARLRAAGCVFAEDEARLLTEAVAGGSAASLADLVDRRVSGVPLEHLLGWAEFAGGRVEVDPGVFVPRRRSQVLVDAAVARAGPGAVVVDLCCGSGAIGLAVARARPDVHLHAVDVDPVAVACANRNLAAVSAQAHVGDLCAALPAGLRRRIDVVVANAPYVPTAQIAAMPPEARLYEPRQALDGGADGLAVQDRVITQAAGWLRAGGYVLLETSVHQATAGLAALARAGFAAQVVRRDDIDGTALVGRRGQVC